MRRETKDQCIRGVWGRTLLQKSEYDGISSNEQLYLALGVPLLGVIANVAICIALYVHLTGRLDRLGERLMSKLDTLTGKVIAVDNRLLRIETKLGIG